MFLRTNLAKLLKLIAGKRGQTYIYQKLFKKLELRVSTGFQTLENNKTPWPAASWFSNVLSRLET